MKTKTLALLATAGVFVAAGFGGWNWWRAGQLAEFIAQSTPATPDISHWPEPMRRRVAAAESRLPDEPAAAFTELARLYHANGFFTEASLCYAILERLDPKNPRWPHLHASILAGYGDTDPALPLWERTVALAPDYLPARLRLADVLIKRNDFARAQTVFRAILADHPDELYAQLGLARCALEAGHLEEARAILEPLVVKSKFSLGYDIIANVYQRLGLEEKAREVGALYRASGAYRDLDDPWLERIHDDCYDSYRLSLAAGAAQRNRDNALAFRRIEQAIAIAPEQAPLHFQLAGMHLENKAYSKARQSLERCTQLQPDFADGWAHLSNVCETLGDRTASDRALAQGLRLCPNSPGLHLQYAQRLVRDQRPEEAIAEFRESIRLRPNEADAYLGLAATLIRLGRNDEGMAAVDGALRAEPAHPSALSIRTFNAILSSDELSALQWLRRAQNQPRMPREDLDRLLGAFREKFGRDPR